MMSAGPDDPLSDQERNLLQEWKRVYSCADSADLVVLPSSLFGFYIGRSAVRLVRHPLFPDALGRAKAAAEKKAVADAEAARIRLEAMQAEQEQRRAERFLDFFYYRGIVYGASKYQKRDGNTIFPVTEFFLKRADKADEQIEIWRYDLPIANGQEVAVVYGRVKGEKTGHPVVYCNYAIQKSIKLADAFNDVCRRRNQKVGHGIHPDEELQEFLTRCRL